MYQNELILLDLPINGQTRKTLVRPERNGYVYVLDRVTGEVLSADPYAFNTSISGIDPGWGNDLLPALVSGLASQIEQVRCQEIFDYSTYDAEESVRFIVGMGQPMDYEPPMVAAGIPSSLAVSVPHLIGIVDGRGLAADSAAAQELRRLVRARWGDLDLNETPLFSVVEVRGHLAEIVPDPTGAFYVELVRWLRAQGQAIDSCTLWAPACTMDVFRQDYLPAIEDGSIRRFSLFALDDALRLHPAL